MTIYDRIKARREELGMSQEELAKRTGYTDRSSIAKIESGVNDITQSKVVAFAKALHTTVSYLMGTDNESPLPQTENELSPEELSIIKKYRTASPEIKNAVKRIVEL